MNRVAALAWQHVFGFDGAESNTKRIPDLVFNAASAMKLAFMRGYLLGDGTVAERRVCFTTSSYEIASGLVYLLSSLGVVPTQREMQPDGVVREIRGEPCETRLKSLDHHRLCGGGPGHFGTRVAGPRRSCAIEWEPGWPRAQRQP